MRLFITGAAKYIGLSISTIFRRSGYQVFGLAGSEDEIVLLESNEIVPITGSLQNPDSYRDIAGQCDVLIYTASDHQAESVPLHLFVVDRLLEAARDTSQPKTLIYTSSVWVLGDCGDSERSGQAGDSLAHESSSRTEIEERVLIAKDLNSIVIRPGVVYGKAGGYTGMWFHGASNGGVLPIVGNGYNRWAMVHVDDLAAGCLLAARSGCAGEIFNLVDSYQSTVIEMASAAAKAAGNIRQLEFIPKEKAVQEMGRLAEMLALDQVLEAGKASRMLGWQPRRQGFIAEVDTYYRSWRANRF